MILHPPHPHSRKSNNCTIRRNHSSRLQHYLVYLPKKLKTCRGRDFEVSIWCPTQLSGQVPMDMARIQQEGEGQYS